MVVVDGGPAANLSGTTAAKRPELAGTVLQDMVRPFSINLTGGGKITGTVQDRVVREKKTGTLDFYYRITNDVTSTGTGPAGVNTPTIDTAVRRHFPAGISTDVDYRTDGRGQVAPSTASRGGQTAVGFVFTAAIGPGQQTRFFFVKTSATKFDGEGNLSITGGSEIGDMAVLSTFQPVKARRAPAKPKPTRPAKTRRPVKSRQRPKPAGSKSKRSKRSSPQKTRTRRPARRTPKR